jgi:hypothetical protein
MWGGKAHSGDRWERGLSWVGSAYPTKQGKHFTQTLQYYRPAGVDGRLTSSLLGCESKNLIVWKSFFFFELYFTVTHAEYLFSVPQALEDKIKLFWIGFGSFIPPCRTACGASPRW